MRPRGLPFRHDNDGRKGLRELTPVMRNALRLLFSDVCFIRRSSGWQSQSGIEFQDGTISALFDRYLVKVFVENRPTPGARYVASLTDIGQLAASAIVGIPVECSIEDATLVYGEAAE